MRSSVLKGTNFSPATCSFGAVQLAILTHCNQYASSFRRKERYMEDPGAWGDEWPENPPIYEAADM